LLAVRSGFHAPRQKKIDGGGHAKLLTGKEIAPTLCYPQGVTTSLHSRDSSLLVNQRASIINLGDTKTTQDAMPKIRNLLISLGAFWLSLHLTVLFAWLFGKLNERVIYGDSVFAAIAMGAMTSMGRALAASLAAVLVTLVAVSPKPQRWAYIVALLYLVAPPVRYHWHVPPTTWYRLWQGVDRAWPVVACILAAVITARLQQKIREAKAESEIGSVSKL
jgi:hypothetical protein